MIELLVKTVGLYTFKINVTLDDTVADVKRAIEIKTSNRAFAYPAARLVIVHAGRILQEDDTTLKENGVTEKSHLVILKSPKDRGSGGESSSASAEKLESESDEPASPGLDWTPLNLLTDSEREAVERLMAMGYTEIDAWEAFVACDRNEERALNYLIDQSKDS